MSIKKRVLFWPKICMSLQRMEFFDLQAKLATKVAMKNYGTITAADQM